MKALVHLPFVLPISLLLLLILRIHVAESLSSMDATRIATTTTGHDKPLLKWLIVGGGPHGVHIAARLLEEVPSIQRSNLCIVDDDPQLLQKWKTRTAATGMTHLRSSASYHLDVREDSLKRYATATPEEGERQSHRRRRNRRRRRRQTNSGPTTTSSKVFAPDYQRPLLHFFNQHCDYVMDKYHLEETHIQGMVTHIDTKEKDDECVVVQIQRPNGDTVEMCAEHIVLALGNGELVYPDWVDPLTVENGQVRHIFDFDVDVDNDNNNNNNNNHNNKDSDELKNEVIDTPTDLTTISHCGPPPRSIAVVGGGISAAHLALKLEREASSSSSNHNHHNDRTTIHMICRHDLREQQFDTHQDWMMDSIAAQRSQEGGGQGLPECQRHFASVDSFVERRHIIQRERQAGTVSASVSRGKDGLRYAIEQERIQWHKGDIVQSSSSSSSSSTTESEEEDHSSPQVSLLLTSGETVVVDQVMLATGFGKRPPGYHLLQDIARQQPTCKLCACGYPAPDKTLRWHERIYVAGALAELELGPSARNIAGARLASERIVAAAQANTNNMSLVNHKQRVAAVV